MNSSIDITQTSCVAVCSTDESSGTAVIVKNVLWFTGLSGAGKSALANGLDATFRKQNLPSIVLDGDSLRAGLNSDLGFSSSDRAENVRRTAEVALLFQRAGFFVIVALISPFAVHREMARMIIGENFCEVHVCAPMSVCEARDPKGLYAKARRGEIAEFTGIGSPYEHPVSPDLIIDTANSTLAQSVELLHGFVHSSKFSPMPRR